MQTRYKNRAKIFDIVITAVGGTLSVGVMLYGVFHLDWARRGPNWCSTCSTSLVWR